MKPIFSVHAGEYLVATYIEEHYKHLNVWVPSKDTGVDLLVTDKTNRKSVSLQVKFSKDFVSSKDSEIVVAKVKAGGWWTFKKKKLCASQADFWILVLYGFASKKSEFVIIRPQELWQRYNTLGRTQDVIQSYVSVTEKGCWETRDLKQQQRDAVANGEYTNPIRDLSKYLNDWPSVEAKLS